MARIRCFYLFEEDALARWVWTSDDLDSALWFRALVGVGHKHRRTQFQQRVSGKSIQSTGRISGSILQISHHKRESVPSLCYCYCSMSGELGWGVAVLLRGAAHRHQTVQLSQEIQYLDNYYSEYFRLSRDKKATILFSTIAHNNIMDWKSRRLSCNSDI